METKTISSFNEILLKTQKPLILCDIDDTFLKFKYSLSLFYKKIKKDNPGLTSKQLRNATIKTYTRYVRKYNPNVCDKEGFINMCNRVKELSGEIMFITARSRSAEKWTRKHFQENFIDYDNFKVHYTPSKGEYIKNYIDTNGKGEIIFIDDQERFIHDVKNINPLITCYKFKCN